MNDLLEIPTQTKDVGDRLRTVLRRLSRLVAGPADQGLLDRLPDLVNPNMAHDGEGQMPGQYPRRDRTSTGRVGAVLIHEAKLAIVRYWELVLRDEVLGLNDLIERLEGYAKDGLGKYDLAGTDAEGYHLVRKAQPGELKKAARKINAAPAPRKN